ncbi:MAG: DUF2911 domain-containing protein [Gemmatimonas sp.]|jgi:hypothetical protein|uniref:DUF2911 domain-containing protein n=1 Tax=Gemmatimonas sp. TaxID=1962908 RepID=UPI0031C2F0BC|nr:DUF2911 domain-containing protein [Gemmatimonas sp.]
MVFPPLLTLSAMRHSSARFVRPLLAVPIALAMQATAATAQIVASERASVTQTVDGTTITVDYSRPRLRGRTNIYGGLEKWGTVWTPGADDATAIRLSRPAMVAGLRVPAGRFSVWFVLREKEPWTLVLDPRDSLFHTAHPDSTAAQLRAPIVPFDVPNTEVLTWAFPDVSIRGTTLEFRWGTKGVAVPIVVEPTLPLTVTAAEVAAFLGSYDFEWADSTSQPRRSVFTVERRGDQLFGTWDTPQLGSLREMQLLSHGTDRFAYGWYRNGSLWATSLELNLEFARRDGRVVGFTYKSSSEVVARGTRRP